MGAIATRRKLSTTVSPEAYEYLEELVSAGTVASLAEAVDSVVQEVRRREQRSRLESDTTAYFARLPRRAREEESRLAAALGSAADEVDFSA